MILELRIDERLAHGQVCTTWINSLGATHLIVANDDVANDSFQKSIMAMGVPGTCKSMFCSIEKAVELINNPKAESLRLFLVVQTPRDALELIPKIKETIHNVNLANFGSLIRPKGEVKLSMNGGLVLLDEEDFEIIKKIKELVPNTYSIDILGHSKKDLKI